MCVFIKNLTKRGVIGDSMLPILEAILPNPMRDPRTLVGNNSKLYVKRPVKHKAIPNLPPKKSSTFNQEIAEKNRQV